MWTEVGELGQLVREGKTAWEDLDLDDVDIRLKWSGLFHRRKRTPGRFMMRLKVPNGELTSDQLRFLGESIAPYGDDGCADITTRANIQLRGIPADAIDTVFFGLQRVGLSSVMSGACGIENSVRKFCTTDDNWTSFLFSLQRLTQLLCASGMDNVRNLTGSPIAGIDPHEHMDSRPLCKAIDDMVTNHGVGNPELTNLPRKINIAVSTSRDDFPHCHINDLALRVGADHLLTTCCHLQQRVCFFACVVWQLHSVLYVNRDVVLGRRGFRHASSP